MLTELIKEATKARAIEDLTEQDFIDVEEEITAKGIAAILDELATQYGLVAIDDDYFEIKDKLHFEIMRVLRGASRNGLLTFVN